MHTLGLDLTYPRCYQCCMLHMAPRDVVRMFEQKMGPSCTRKSVSLFSACIRRYQAVALTPCIKSVSLSPSSRDIVSVVYLALHGGPYSNAAACAWPGDQHPHHRPGYRGHSGVTGDRAMPLHSPPAGSRTRPLFSAGTVAMPAVLSLEAIRYHTYLVAPHVCR